MKPKLEEIRSYLLSDDTIDTIATERKWSYHGTDIIELFEELGEEESYANTADRKRILKQYLRGKASSIFKDITEESPKQLHRAIYVDSEVDIKQELGVYWSSRGDTEPCVQNDEKIEVVMTIDFDAAIVDWEQTLLSRIDFIHGDREREYHLIYDLVLSDVSNFTINVRQ